MSRHTRHSLSLATFPIIAALCGQHFYAPEGEGGGAGGGTAIDDKGKAKAEAKKIELTEDELTARISAATEAAVKKAKDDAAADAKKKADADAAKLAKEQGDFKKLYDGEVELKKVAERERDEARAAARAKDIEIALGRYLAKNHKDYVDAAEWIRPHVKVEADADEATVEKAIKDTVDQYVKANPRTPAPPKPGASAAVTNLKNAPARTAAEPPPRRPYSTIHSRF
jgi:hypothetical protein